MGRLVWGEEENRAKADYPIFEDDIAIVREAEEDAKNQLDNTSKTTVRKMGVRTRQRR